MAAAADAADPRLVRMLDGVSTGAGRRWLVAPRADLGARADAESAATVGAARAALDDGPLSKPRSGNHGDDLGSRPNGSRSCRWVLTGGEVNMTGRRPWAVLLVLVLALGFWGTPVSPQPLSRLTRQQVEAALRLDKNLALRDL